MTRHIDFFTFCLYQRVHYNWGVRSTHLCWFGTVNKQLDAKNRCEHQAPTKFTTICIAFRPSPGRPWPPFCLSGRVGSRVVGGYVGRRSPRRGLCKSASGRAKRHLEACHHSKSVKVRCIPRHGGSFPDFRALGHVALTRKPLK